MLRQKADAAGKTGQPEALKTAAAWRVVMKAEDREYYGIYAPLLERTRKVILAELDKITEEITQDSELALIEHVLSRIKSAASIQEKLRQNHLDTNARSAVINLSDAVGIRIVTHFVGDVYVVRDLLRKSDVWTIVKEKDYIAAPKPNGYRSLHVILELPAEGIDVSGIQAEIQLRTIAMDCWASLEHQMRYKKNITNTRMLETELKRCADEMASTDLSMQTIREMIQGQ